MQGRVSKERFLKLLDKTRSLAEELKKRRSFMNQGTPSPTFSVSMSLRGRDGKKMRKPEFVIDYATGEGKKVLGVEPGEINFEGQTLNRFLIKDKDANIFFEDVAKKWGEIKNALEREAKAGSAAKNRFKYSAELRNIIEKQEDTPHVLSLKVGNKLVDAFARVKIYPETDLDGRFVLNTNPKIGLTLNNIDDIFKRYDFVTDIFHATDEINKAASKEEIFGLLSNKLSSMGGGFSFIAIPEGDHLKIISHSDNLKPYLNRKFGKNYALPRIPIGFGAMGEAAKKLSPVSMNKNEMAKAVGELKSSGADLDRYKEIMDFRNKLTFTDYHAQPLFIIDKRTGEKVLIAVAGIFKSHQLSEEKKYNKEFSDSQKRLFKMISNSSAVKLNNQQVQDQLEYLAYHDQATGLGTRHHFKHVFTELLKNFEGEVKDKQKKVFDGFTVNYVDANGLKLINDTFGHEVGDRFVHNVAETIREFSSKRKFPKNLQWRFGGDEFVFISPTDQGLTEGDKSEFKEMLRKKLDEDELISGAISKVGNNDLGRMLKNAINTNAIGATIASDSFNEEKFMDVLKQKGPLERFTRGADENCMNEKKARGWTREQLEAELRKLK